jgi:hypothetical protein
MDNSPFFRLLPELRDQIYELVLSRAHCAVFIPSRYQFSRGLFPAQFVPPLLQVSSLIRKETMSMWYASSTITIQMAYDYSSAGAWWLQELAAVINLCHHATVPQTTIPHKQHLAAVLKYAGNLKVMMAGTRLVHKHSARLCWKAVVEIDIRGVNEVAVVRVLEYCPNKWGTHDQRRAKKALKEILEMMDHFPGSTSKAWEELCGRIETGSDGRVSLGKA